MVTLLMSDNDAMMGYDPAPRGPIELPPYYKSTKDGQFMCKAHANTNCKSCCKCLRCLSHIHLLSHLL